MSIEKVTWDISRGLSAETNLINQINFVLNELTKDEFKKLRVVAAYNGHHKDLGFYAISTLRKNNVDLNIYYILNKIMILGVSDKKNLRIVKGYEDLFWDNRSVVIDKFEVMREHYVGLDLEEQVAVLKSWGRKCIQKFESSLVENEVK